MDKSLQIENKIFKLLETEDPEGKYAIQAIATVLATFLTDQSRDVALGVLAKIVVMMETAKVINSALISFDAINKAQNKKTKG